MLPNKYKLDGIPQIAAKPLPSQEFDALLTSAGYSKIGTAPAKGNRVETWWRHPTFKQIEAICSPDGAIAITAYHVN